MPDKDPRIVFDAVSLIVGIIIGAIAWTAFTVSVSFIDSDSRLVLDDPSVEAAIASRIEPVGHVMLLDSEELAAARAATLTQPDAATGGVTTPLTGREVYEQMCMACHSPAGAATGAPTIGDGDAWANRVAQGMDTLIEHALNGFTGDIGEMPAKGGFTSLSDDEVISAVQYMVDQLDD